MANISGWDLFKQFKQNKTIVRNDYKVIFNGPATIVILKDGSRGVAKLMDGDTYNEKTGENIAYVKALIKSHQKQIKSLQQKLRELSK